MNLKTKLYLGLGFLTALILVLWGSGLLFINQLADNSSAIIQNNSRTVVYMQDMEQTLTDLYKSQTTAFFDEKPGRLLSDAVYNTYKDELYALLQKQEANLTEAGEREITSQLRRSFQEYFSQYERLKNESGPSVDFYERYPPLYARLSDLMAQITYINLEAISRKNDRAQQTARNVNYYMILIGALSVVLSGGMLLRYPGYIADPIRQLTERIKKIAEGSYDQRLSFETGDEYEELAEAFNTMAARLQSYENTNMARLMNEKQRIEAIIDNMGDGVLGLDRDRNILFVNAKASELLDLPKNNLIGRYAPDVASTSDMMHKMIRELPDDTWRNQTDDGEEELIKIDHVDPPRYYSREYIRVTRPEQQGKSREDIGSIIILKNVTRFQELDEAKTNFISVVSHELKTPIASIDLSLKLLNDKRVGSLNDEQQKLVESIGDDTRRMKRTTGELLDLSRIETGNIQLNIQEASPSDLVQYAYETMIMQATRKNIELEIEMQDDLPKVKTDQQKSVWVLVNLISNAIRYTPSNGRVSLKAQRNHDYIRFVVKDNGKGIAAEYLDKIFQKYFQVQGNRDEQRGSGLGLAIAKEFIQAQGGKIWAESEPGKGSIFYFTLPTV